MVAVRLGRTGLARVDDLAKSAGLSRSDTIRELLKLGEAKYRSTAGDVDAHPTV